LASLCFFAWDLFFANGWSDCICGAPDFLVPSASETSVAVDSTALSRAEVGAVSLVVLAADSCVLCNFGTPGVVASFGGADAGPSDWLEDRSVYSVWGSRRSVSVAAGGESEISACVSYCESELDLV
jgi:hypothetical protein